MFFLINKRSSESMVADSVFAAAILKAGGNLWFASGIVLAEAPKRKPESLKRQDRPKRQRTRPTHLLDSTKMIYKALEKASRELREYEKDTFTSNRVEFKNFLQLRADLETEVQEMAKLANLIASKDQLRNRSANIDLALDADSALAFLAQKFNEGQDLKDLAPRLSEQIEEYMTQTHDKVEELSSLELPEEGEAEEISDDDLDMGPPKGVSKVCQEFFRNLSGLVSEETVSLLPDFDIPDNENTRDELFEKWFAARIPNGPEEKTS